MWRRLQSKFRPLLHRRPFEDAMADEMILLAHPWGIDLGSLGDLRPVRALGTTGSPLSPEVQVWGTEQFRNIGTADIWWCNISGGTDFAGAFIGGNRELPQIVGQINVLPKHWWEGTDASGNKRDIRSPTLEAPSSATSSCCASSRTSRRGAWRCSASIPPSGAPAARPHSNRPTSARVPSRCC